MAAEQRIETAVRTPITTVAAAIAIIADCRAVAETAPGPAQRGLAHVLGFLRRIVTGDNIHDKFFLRGPNLSIASTACHQVLVELGALEERFRIGLGGRRPSWDGPLEMLRAAGPYLEILNGEAAAEDSALVNAVTEATDMTLTCLGGGVALVIAAPLVVTFLAEAGVVGAAGHVVRAAALRLATSAAATRVVTMVMTHPQAALEVASFAVGTAIAIGSAGGPTNWLAGMTTWEGARDTAADIVVLYLAIRAGRSPDVPPRTRYVRLQTQVTTRTPQTLEVRVVHAEVVDELPAAAPPKARMAPRPLLDPALLARRNALPANFAKADAQQAIQRARRASQVYPGSVEDTHGGVCECSAVSGKLATEFPGGAVEPASGGDHTVYRWPARVQQGETRAVLDASAAQFTEFVADTPAGQGKRLIPLARLRAEVLLQAVKEGIFTELQHERFLRLVREMGSR
jgi:hypothetical protein